MAIALIRAVTSNAFPAPQELYERIKSENPLCIDMETSAFYQVAWHLQARVLVIRGISNRLQADGSVINCMLPILAEAPRRRPMSF